ncbi:hypothetical protein Acr_00g0003430 [Actinidia rufa]|uniref:Uncharacterized protein n=1 Tax=Actinidia rufa TaxID=165716 RepID=A0A7J0D8Y4_9ERIC|nr:hypothetical protein Acr_00g0003430 [Actinidia rufa]
MALIPASRLQFLVISRIPEAARLSDLIGNQRCFFLQPEMDFLGDIWQAIRALGIPPVPLPDRVVWALDTEEDFFFSLSRERKMKRVRAFLFVHLSPMLSVGQQPTKVSVLSFFTTPTGLTELSCLEGISLSQSRMPQQRLSIFHNLASRAHSNSSASEASTGVRNELPSSSPDLSENFDDLSRFFQGKIEEIGATCHPTGLPKNLPGCERAKVACKGGWHLTRFFRRVQCSRMEGKRISETNRASMERRNLLPSIQKYLLLTLRCADQQRDSTHELVQGQVQLTLSMPCHSGGTGTTEWGGFHLIAGVWNTSAPKHSAAKRVQDCFVEWALLPSGYTGGQQSQKEIITAPFRASLAREAHQFQMGESKQERKIAPIANKNKGEKKVRKKHSHPNPNPKPADTSAYRHSFLSRVVELSR